MDDFMGEKRIMVRRWNRTKKYERKDTHTPDLTVYSVLVAEPGI